MAEEYHGLSGREAETLREYVEGFNINHDTAARLAYLGGIKQYGWRCPDTVDDWIELHNWMTTTAILNDIPNLHKQMGVDVRIAGRRVKRRGK